MASDKIETTRTARHPLLITFSGIDGAGKTTQIEHLVSRLEKRGLRVLRLGFWDHVAAWSTMRAGIGHRSADFSRAHQADQHSFSPKNNKHIRKWYLTVARSALYLLDTARLRRVLGGQNVKTADVVVFDRYIYDQIANIYSQSLSASVYSKLLLKLAPAPDLAFVINASPVAAFARKPEYPLAFLYENRRNFLQLCELVPQMIVVAEGSEDSVKREIEFHVDKALGAVPIVRKSESRDSAVVAKQSSCRVENEPTAIV